MKEILTILIVSMFLLSPILLLAEETNELPDAGDTPDSFTYGFKRFFQGVDMFFTFDDKQKASKHMYYAKLRLAEAKKMAGDGKEEYLEMLLNDYESEIGSAALSIGQKNIEDAAEAAEGVASGTGTGFYHLIKLKLIIKEKYKERVQSAIDTTETQNEKALEIYEKIDKGKSIRMRIKIAEKVLDSIEETSEEGEDTTTGSEIYQEKIALINEKIDNLDIADEEKETLRQYFAERTAKHLEVLAQVYDKVPEQAKAGIQNALDNSAKGYENVLDKLEENGQLWKILERVQIKNEVKQKIKIKIRERSNKNDSNNDEDDEDDNGDTDDNETDDNESIVIPPQIDIDDDNNDDNETDNNETDDDTDNNETNDNNETEG